MPDGQLQRIDAEAGHAMIVREGRRYVAPLSEVATDARIVGARVHFDHDHVAGPDTVKGVSLLSGTRTNKRQRRFGDLTGAKRPGTKVKTTAALRLGVDVTTQPTETIAGWIEAVQAGSFDDAVSLYAPNAVMHAPDRTYVGRRAIRAALEDLDRNQVKRFGDADLATTDQLVRLVGLDDLPVAFEVHRGAIIEHWMGLPLEDAGPNDDEPDVTIIRTGTLTGAEEQRLRTDIARIVRRLPRAADEVRVKIDEPELPNRPYSVSAAIHAGPLHVRSHVTAPTLSEAIDDACLRLRSQVQKAVDRRVRPPERHRPDVDSWRHGDRRRLLHDAASSVEQPSLVRRKTWGPHRSTVDEAIWDMEQADYDFYLFTEERTGEVGLVWRTEDGVAVQLESGTGEVDTAFATISAEPAPRMNVAEAMLALDELSLPFLFARSATDEAFVLYRRLDGDFGVIEPASA